MLQSLPIAHQLPLIQGGPFNHHGGGTTREFACQHLDRVNPDLDFILAIDGVEVWWHMFIKVHANDDPKEPANFRHSISLFERFPQLSAGRR